MPTFINVDYEIPERKDEDYRKYILEILIDVRNNLIKLDPQKGTRNLEETLEIIKEGTYTSQIINLPVPYKIDFSEIKRLLEEYKKKDRNILNKVLEGAGQLA